MLALIVQQRRRASSRCLRAIAATPRQIRTMIRTELIVLSSIGAVAGLWPGRRLAALADTIFKSKGIIPDGYVAHREWSPWSSPLLLPSQSPSLPGRSQDGERRMCDQSKR